MKKLPLIFFCGMMMFPILLLSQEKKVDPPGRMVDAGGFKLHLLEEGTQHNGKGPTVIFFHGAGDVALHWNLVLPKVGKFAAAIAIDQNGEAWSEHGHNKSLNQQIFDSYQALQNGGYKGPYIVVGHSLGGIMALLFAKEFHKEVAGVILVDGTHPDVVLKVFDKETKKANWKKFRLTADDGIPEIIKTPLIRKSEITSVKIQRDFGNMLKDFPKEDQQLIDWLYNIKLLTYVKGKGNDYSAEIFADMYDHREKYHLGDIPLVIISGGAKSTPEGDENWTSEALVKQREFLQKDLLTFSNNSQQVMASKSGHHIHIDQPKLVVKEIKRLIKKVV